LLFLEICRNIYLLETINSLRIYTSFGNLFIKHCLCFYGRMFGIKLFNNIPYSLKIVFLRLLICLITMMIRMLYVLRYNLWDFQHYNFYPCWHRFLNFKLLFVYLLTILRMLFFIICLWVRLMCKDGRRILNTSLVKEEIWNMSRLFETKPWVFWTKWSKNLVILPYKQF